MTTLLQSKVEMQTLKSEIDVHLLASRATSLDYWIDGTGILMSITQSGGLPEKAKNLFGAAISEIEKLTKLKAINMMINDCKPGLIIPKHVDPVKGDKESNCYHSRWHLPLITNESCAFWCKELDYVHFPIGYWSGPVEYWKEHSVYNLGETNRIHLIVDLK